MRVITYCCCMLFLTCCSKVKLEYAVYVLNDIVSIELPKGSVVKKLNGVDSYTSLYFEMVYTHVVSDLYEEGPLIVYEGERESFRKKLGALSDI